MPIQHSQITLSERNGGYVIPPEYSDESFASLVYSMKRDPVKELAFKLFAIREQQLGWVEHDWPTPKMFGQAFEKADLQAFVIALREGHMAFETPSKYLVQLPRPDQLPAPAPVDPEDVEDVKGESNLPEIPEDNEEPDFEPEHETVSDETGVLSELKGVLGKLGIGGGSVDRSQVVQIVKETENALLSDLTKTFNQLLETRVDARFEELRKRQTVDVRIIREEGEKIVVGQHKLFPKLLKWLSVGVNIALVGPAGGGKTQAMENACEAMGIKFEATSLGPQTPQSELKGFIDANGQYRDTAFYRTFTSDNTLWLGDEADAAHAGVFTSINAGTSNHTMGFPNGMQKRGKGNLFALNMNTYGRGHNRDYIGRNELDGATLNRFVFMDWDYDENLELEIALAINPDCGAWVEHVQKIRKCAFDLKARIIVSPRASFDGARLLKINEGWPTIEKGTIWKGVDPKEEAKVQAALKA